MSFGQLPRGGYVRVLDHQPFSGAARLYVQETADDAFGYVDAIHLAPSGPPPDSGRQDSTVPSVIGAPLFQPFWVANHAPATLWSSPNEGDPGIADLPAFSKLLVLAPATGTRYYAQDARSERLGYIDSWHVGPSDALTAEELAPAPA
ncbi:MAG TPA: hypothetical protein VGW38_13665, partial [Chloroflexota bacterium]|nr:hypothetical protein [Chloroflexota bacterium]